MNKPGVAVAEELSELPSASVAGGALPSGGFTARAGRVALVVHEPLVTSTPGRVVALAGALSVRVRSSTQPAAT